MYAKHLPPYCIFVKTMYYILCALHKFNNFCLIYSIIYFIRLQRHSNDHVNHKSENKNVHTKLDIEPELTLRNILN